jgi:phosphotransferase system  glucose/maltose/N-acetylglucosamine-specific IIC component
MALFLNQMVRTLIYVQMNHLMVMEGVHHMRIAMVTRLLLKVGRTC